MSHRSLSTLVLSACVLGGCAPAARPLRPTLLNHPPPLPLPGPDEARLLPVELTPTSAEVVETPPGDSLESMARRALDGAQDSVVRCYAAVLPRAPDAAGRVEVQLDLSGDGSVTRVHVDHRGEGGLSALVPCLEEVFRAVRVRDVPPRGQYVSRIYVFSNPLVARAVAQPVLVHAPAPPVRARRTARGRARGVEAQVVAPATASVPAPGPGVLRDDELSAVLTDHPAIGQCYATALRRARGVAGPATLTLDVRPDGTVENARFESSVRALQRASDCVAAGARLLRLRASGIRVAARVPLLFRR